MRTEPTWSRNQLWAEHDARTARRNRRRSLAVSIGCSTLWLGLTVTSYSWRGIPLSEPNPPAAECRVNGDCVLLPSVVTCCGECGPAAPYEAAPRDVLDLLRRATDESCAPTTRVCDPPVCPAQEVCSNAQPVCDEGRCAVWLGPCTPHP